jgi:hypothetical protein
MRRPVLGTSSVAVSSPVGCRSPRCHVDTPAWLPIEASPGRAFAGAHLEGGRSRVGSWVDGDDLLLRRCAALEHQETHVSGPDHRDRSRTDRGTATGPTTQPSGSPESARSNRADHDERVGPRSPIGERWPESTGHGSPMYSGHVAPGVSTMLTARRCRILGSGPPRRNPLHSRPRRRPPGLDLSRSGEPISPTLDLPVRPTAADAFIAAPARRPRFRRVRMP